jgi:hypothetical protein
MFDEMNESHHDHENKGHALPARRKATMMMRHRTRLLVEAATLYLLLILPWYVAAWSPQSSQQRRRLVGTTVGILGGLWGGPSVIPTLAADSALFRPNPLINPVLEQFRIWDQEYADNIKYGGELERGDAGNKGKVDAYPRLLVPILDMADDLDRVHQAVMDGRSTFPLAITILQQPKFTKTEFKKVFNAYADNIYYSDPDRANLYLAGGGE